MSAGVAVAAFSGRRSGAVAARMKELRVPHLVQACSDKVAALHRLTGRLKIDPLNCACIVDDTPDLPLMSAVGFAAAVADAHPLVKSGRPLGGRGARRRGAVRELCDAILRARAARRTDAVPGVHGARGTGTGRQHLDIDFAGAQAACQNRRQTGGVAGLLPQERRAHRLRSCGRAQRSHRSRAHRSDRARRRRWRCTTSVSATRPRTASRGSWSAMSRTWSRAARWSTSPATCACRAKPPGGRARP